MGNSQKVTPISSGVADELLITPSLQLSVHNLLNGREEEKKCH
jgi:hypothetical protein